VESARYVRRPHCATTRIGREDEIRRRRNDSRSGGKYRKEQVTGGRVGLEAGSWQLGAGSWKLESRNQKQEPGSWKREEGREKRRGEKISIEKRRSQQEGGS
jgi:hypothetical protein